MGCGLWKSGSAVMSLPECTKPEERQGVPCKVPGRVFDHKSRKASNYGPLSDQVTLMDRAVTVTEYPKARRAAREAKERR